MWIGYYDDSITDKPKFSGWKEISFDIANMTGATASANGKAGLVPAPDTASRLKFLRGDGIWATPANTTYGVVSKTANGLAPKLPNETTTTKYLRQDGTWTVPPDTKYTHPATAGNKHIPAGGKAGQFLKWSADGTAVWAADNNTTYGNMTAATASAAGKAGLVPAPGAGKQASYLRGDGTWAVPPNTTYAAATQSKNGLMSAADKKKLDGITIETGSWTPVFKGLDTAGSFTYGEDRKGTYLKIGNYVYIEAQLPVSKVNTAPKGTYVVEGMPFNSKKWAAGTINIGFSGGTEGAVNNGFRSITSGGMMYTEMRFRQMLENQIQSEFASWNVNIPVGSNFEIDFSGSYQEGDRFTYGDNFYKVLQDHTSEEQWKPGEAPSLYVLVSDPAVEWPEWREPTGAHDAYNTGDKVTYNGKRYVSKIDGNTTVPGSDERYWKPVEN